MDIARPDQSKARRKKRIIYGSLALLGLIAITVVLAKLKPAAPTIEGNLLWPDTVKRGQMIRQVRGLGTLVPEEIRWIAARTQGRVDKIILRPGAPVTTDSVILMLTNPDVEQAFTNAELVEVIGSVLGRTLRYHEVSAELVRQRFLSLGFSAEFADANLAYLEATVAKPALVTHEVEKILGRPPETFAEGIAAHRELFTNH